MRGARRKAVCTALTSPGNSSAAVAFSSSTSQLLGVRIVRLFTRSTAPGCVRSPYTQSSSARR